MPDPVPTAPKPEPASSKTSVKRRILRYLAQSIVLLLVIAAVRVWQQRGVASGPVPPLPGLLLDGRPVAAAVQKGQPLLVHFWATWCPICSAEQASIESLATVYPTVTVAMQSGDREEVIRHLQKEGLHFPVLNDPDGAIAAQWGVRAVPASFIIDTAGQIRFVEIGYTTGVGLRIRLWLADWWNPSGAAGELH